MKWLEEKGKRAREPWERAACLCLSLEWISRASDRIERSSTSLLVPTLAAENLLLVAELMSAKIQSHWLIFVCGVT